MGKYSLAALTPELIANFRDTLLNCIGHRGQSISGNTVRLELALLGHLYTVAIQEWGLGLTCNPIQNIPKPSPGEGRDRRLSSDEDKRLFAGLRQHSNPILAWIARIALETGMCSSEILTLTRSQVDVKRRVVRLTDTKNNEARLVPLTLAATEVFKLALNNPVRPLDCDLVFFGEPGKDGKRGSYAYTKLWNQAKKQARLDDFRFHDLRHEALSRLVEAGLSDQEVAAISGHKSMQMLRRYTHLRAEDLVVKLDRVREV
ncbi:site-specific integrase [Cobetia sp. UCD-24C]|uniref:site-specific integrase n=1 Tax=Cobetia sp. UCD-24C TaxID=1716176 RepID=UPI000A4A3EA2|nr:site-specific integrase [Cobetia sp. UCD-24C]